MSGAVYRGNTALGQLADSSGNGNTLTLHGTVPVSLTPTPPEGNQWLVYRTPNNILVDYLESPADVYDPISGSLEFYFSKEETPFENTEMVSLRTPGFPYDGFIIFISPDDNLYVAGVQNGFGLFFYATPIPNSPSASYKINLTWGPSGSTVTINNVVFGTNGIPVPTTTPTRVYIGGDPDLTARSMYVGGIDFVTISESSLAPAFNNVSISASISLGQ